MKISSATSASGMENGPLVEVMDRQGLLLAVMPVAEVRRQQLCHRSVVVLLYDEAGRLLLHRQRSVRGQLPVRWDAPVRSPVYSGESLQDAATRALEACLGIRAERMRPVEVLAPSLENGNEILHVFSLVRPEGSAMPGQQPGLQPGYHDDASGYCFGPEELGCLLKDFSELVSVRFLQLAEALKLTQRERRPL